MLNKNLTTIFINRVRHEEPRAFCVLGFNGLSVKFQYSYNLCCYSPSSHRVFSSGAEFEVGVKKVYHYALGTLFTCIRVRVNKESPFIIVAWFSRRIFRDFNIDFEGNIVHFWVEGQPRVVGKVLFQFSHLELYNLVKHGPKSRIKINLNDVYVAVGVIKDDYKRLVKAEKLRSLVPALLFKGDEVQLPTQNAE